MRLPFPVPQSKLDPSTSLSGMTSIALHISSHSPIEVDHFANSFIHSTFLKCTVYCWPELGASSKNATRRQADNSTA